MVIDPLTPSVIALVNDQVSVSVKPLDEALAEIEDEEDADFNRLKVHLPSQAPSKHHHETMPPLPSTPRLKNVLQLVFAC